MARIDHYTYRVIWSEEDAQCVGLCAEFPSLSHLASTPEKALRGIRKVVADVIEDMRDNGESVPEPLSSRQYSGKFMVRVPPQVHRQLAREAAEADIKKMGRRHKVQQKKLITSATSTMERMRQKLMIVLPANSMVSLPLRIFREKTTKNSDSRPSCRKI